MLAKFTNCEWIDADKKPCFYFCGHFKRIFKDKEQITDSTFQQTLNGEILVYCSDCEKKITSYLSDIISFDIEHQALEIKKCLIQYFHHSDDYPLFLLKI